MKDEGSEVGRVYMLRSEAGRPSEELMPEVTYDWPVIP